MKPRYYLGLRFNPDVRQVFKSATVPTDRSHGAEYVACIGPFRTKRGAEFMRDNPGPCVITVADAELRAKGGAR